MKRKLKIHKETLMRLDPYSIRRAAAGQYITDGFECPAPSLYPCTDTLQSVGGCGGGGGGPQISRAVGCTVWPNCGQQSLDFCGTTKV